LKSGPEKGNEVIMKSGTMTRCCAVLAAVLTIGSVRCTAATNLGDVLRESGWDRVVGTWIDVETRGVKSTRTFAWRFKDRVLEITARDGNKETVSLMGFNAKTSEVFNLSVDNQGASSLGRWTFEEDQAMLELKFVTGRGQEGALRVTYTLEDEHTMIVTVVLPQPITVKLVRVK
jgi:hypothetical protein